MASCSPEPKGEGVVTHPGADEEEGASNRKRSAESKDDDQDESSLKPTPAKRLELDEAPRTIKMDRPSMLLSMPTVSSEEDHTALPAESTDGKRYQIVAQEDQIEPALANLRKRDVTAPFLAVDCEGDSLSRKGKLSIVSVATASHTYLFDIKKLGAGAFDQGLRGLLEDPTREKLMFDCRQDSDCLWHQYQVKLANVLDLQLMQIIHQESHPIAVGSRRGPRSLARTPNFQPRLRGFFACLEIYVKDDKLIKAKADGMKRRDKEGVCWMERPLDEALLAYAAVDVQGVFPLYHALAAQGAASGSSMVRLREASQKYLDFFRSPEVRSYDKFEKNAYVPWRVIPGLGHTGGYSEETACVGCKRRFPRSDFRYPIKVCPVCKKIEDEPGFLH